MYVLVRVLAFAAVFLALEVAASFAWWATHGADRRTVEELRPRIEALSERVREERDWLARRRASSERLDDTAGRLAEGPEAFPDRAAFDSARLHHARRIEMWNAAIDEHERRNARLDSLADAHDRLVESWRVAYRRAYPRWLPLPRPDPPRQAAGG